MVNDVIDKEVDKEMTKVVEEVNKKLVNEGLVVVRRRKSLKVHNGYYILKKGLLHVNYVLKRFLVETT